MSMPAMTDRERFLATMNYQPRDRNMICDFSFWPETIEEWKKQGLPDWVNPNYDKETQNRFFGMDDYLGDAPNAQIDIFPRFEPRVVEDLGDEEIVIDGTGVTQRRSKHFSSIPMYLDYTLKDRQSWNEHFKWRFDPANPDRYPKDWVQAKKAWSDPHPQAPRKIHAGSFYGNIRDWMGVEGVSFLVYDDPACFEEIVVTMTDCKIGVLEKLFEQGAQYDVASMWEDMCYNAGPLLSPDLFKKYLVPQIKRVTDLLNRHGCRIIWVDSDGKIDDLIPLWLEAGVNCMFPIEIGTWGADPIQFRKQYGKELRMMGGFDKHILTLGKDAIEKEVIRLAPLVEEGGFIPMPDHRVPPNVTLQAHLYYLECARRIWGHGVNLKPMGQ